jgi:hypothetical protein
MIKQGSNENHRYNVLARNSLHVSKLQASNVSSAGFNREREKRRKCTIVAHFCCYIYLVYINIHQHISCSRLYSFCIHPCSCMILKSTMAGIHRRRTIATPVRHSTSTAGELLVNCFSENLFLQAWSRIQQ